MTPVFANVIENAFGPLITAFQEVLVFIHDDIFGGGPGGAKWGWAIIGLTVAVRIVLFPLFMRQMKSIRALQLHMPEMKRIQEKYKDDKQRQSEELMKFYRENKINPLASCLPLLLQLPVLFSLYYMLRTDLKKHICGPALVAHYNTAHHAAIHAAAHLPSKYLANTSCDQVAPHSAHFLFISDLTSKATGWPLAVLMVLYVVTMLASSLLSSASADRSQRLMVIILPLVFTVIVFAFPTGLLVYWISTNIWTIGQGYFVRKSMPPLAQPAAPGKAPGGATAAPAAPPPGGAPAGEPGDALTRLKGVLGRAAGTVEASESNGAAKLEAPPGGAQQAAAPTPPPPRPPRKRRKRRSGRRR
jgi:YidC/Oxa1 family membrane protein insertase